MTRVSVVIPAYNAANTIAETVDSVLAQTLDDIEVIVVDDGSTDSTAERAEREGVSVLSTPNQGVSAARNEGIARAQGRFVAFLDADDLWESDKLERQVEALQHEPNAVMAVSGSRLLGEGGATVEVLVPWASEDPPRDLLLHSMVLGHVISVLIRRDQLERIGGFDPSFSQCADWDFFLRATTAGTLARIPDPLVTIRRDRPSMSSDIELLERDTFGVLDKFFAHPEAGRYEGLKRQAYSNHWMILSGSYLHAGNTRASLRCLRAGLRLHPANIRRPLGAPSRWLRRLARQRQTEQHAQ